MRHRSAASLWLCAVRIIVRHAIDCGCLAQELVRRGAAPLPPHQRRDVFGRGARRRVVRSLRGGGRAVDLAVPGRRDCIALRYIVLHDIISHDTTFVDLAVPGRRDFIALGYIGSYYITRHDIRRSRGT